MKRFAIFLAAGMLVGCESAVLVNNRPERSNPMADSPTPVREPQQASATTPPEITDDAEGAQTAAGATTQPADQSVETSNVRIQSQSI